jgi:hypothetical protein
MRALLCLVSFDEVTKNFDRFGNVVGGGLFNQFVGGFGREITVVLIDLDAQRQAAIIKFGVELTDIDIILDAQQLHRATCR